MKKKLILGMCCLLGFSAPTITLAQNTKEVSVIHFWVSGGEAKALNTIADDLKLKGYNLHGLSANNRSTANSLFNNMLAANKPVDAVLWMPGPSLNEMVDSNIIRNLDSIAKKKIGRKIFII